MILRRVRLHVRNHDWFAVAVDLLIVVVGVFIGIEVANWNQGRQDRSAERRYYSQIREDLVADLEALRIASSRSTMNDRAAELVLQSLESGPPADTAPGAVAVAVHRAGFLYLPMSSRRTYDELISTGNLALLRDETLKDAVVDYYARFEEVRQWDALLREQQKEYWTVAAGVLPRRVLQDSIRGRIPDLSGSELAAILDKARRRERLSDLLVGMAAHQERVRRDSEQVERRTRSLIGALDRRLSLRGS